MPQVRHKNLVATTQIVDDKTAEALLASGDYVLVDLPKVSKGTAVTGATVRKADSARKAAPRTLDLVDDADAGEGDEVE